ncbi:hypothetical protein [Phytohabitans suffuscus]|uniref:hypothetical protein n=1 Tax=Phytohabitans suffuscus TaxID=624315 RepID=UPI00156569F1|nr:hypothetical protein [Phytohabitans suffuscus]
MERIVGSVVDERAENAVRNADVVGPQQGLAESRRVGSTSSFDNTVGRGSG